MNYIVWYAILIHLIWGVMLLVSADPLGTTAIYSSDFFDQHHQFYGLGYMVIAMLALFSEVVKKHLVRVAMLIPQQAVMILSSLGAAKCIINSAYADGVIRPVLFIAADQFPNILATVLHTFALVYFILQKKW